MNKAISPNYTEEKLDKVASLKEIFKSDGASKIYQKKEYIILKVKRGYIVYNTKKEFDCGHTHLHSFEMSKTIIDNSINKKRPKTTNLYLLQSHIRVTNDSKYKRLLEEILKAKVNRSKDNKYYNRGCYSLC